MECAPSSASIIGSSSSEWRWPASASRAWTSPSIHKAPEQLSPEVSIASIFTTGIIFASWRLEFRLLPGVGTMTAAPPVDRMYAIQSVARCVSQPRESRACDRHSISGIALACYIGARIGSGNTRRSVFSLLRTIGKKAHMREYRIAAIPGDGIGTEVIAAGLEVLEVLAGRDQRFRLRVEHFPWSSDYYLKHGHYIPGGGLDKLRTFDAIFFGAVGAPDVPDHLSLWGLRLPICQGFDQYANVRPARVLPGIASPLKGGEAIDWVIVRENSEGEYSGSGGRVHRGLPEELATETSVFTRNGVVRIHRFAFELARKRPRKHLTLVTKSNAQRHGMVMWDEIFYEIARDYPDVATQRVLVDAMTTVMVLKPWSLDVVVASNLHADVLSDLAAALSGSLGIGPTANLNPERKF